ncbi:MAG: hypothetical protein K5989_09465 [Lachnospiraceae bacterium]|nr:hypothetical protein [Lachnospiraceae bacterium]
MKTLLRLIRNFILLSIPLLIIMGYTFIRPMSYMAVEYTMWQEEKDFVHAKAGAPSSERAGEKDPGNDKAGPAEGPERIHTLILGDSRAKSGILPAILGGGDGKGIYNMAIGGATAIEMYFALENYLDCHQAPENAIIIFAPYHFCDIDNWQQTLYYNYLSLGEVLRVESDALRLGENESIRYPGSIADLLSFRLRLPNKYLDAIYQAGLHGRAGENREKYDSVRRDRGYTEFGTEKGNDGLNYETHHSYFDYSPLILHYYDKLLSLCEDKGIHVIIEQSPINEASHAVMQKAFVEGYQEFIQSVADQHPSFTVISEIPVYDNLYFGDNNHMNRSGAEIFSTALSKRYSDVIKPKAE